MCITPEAELLRQCELSGQVSARQMVEHRGESMSVDREELKRLALAAIAKGEAIGEDEWHSVGGLLAGLHIKEDAEFVHAANPAAILALLAQLEAKEAEIVRKAAACQLALSRIVELESDLSALRASCDADEQDAERYRWLRDRLSAADFYYSEPPRPVLVFDWPVDVGIGGNLDMNIDAAIAQMKEPTNG